MTDRESVITHLQIIHTWASFAREHDLQFFTEKHLEDIAQWTNDALELLKEQEAKPVIVTTNAYGTRFYHCPICNFDLHVYPRQLYCSNCGQAVNWND